jgi:large subunit ribosomal protein L9
MKNQRVLLREDVADLGRVGDVVRVSAGFARNYLYPRRLAIQATEDNVRAMKRRRERADAELKVREAEFRGIVDSLTRLELRTTQKADESGHLFGSVNVGLVAKLLRDAGHSIEESRIRMGQPIRTVGRHKARVHVYGDLTAEITVEVEAEATASEA